MLVNNDVTALAAPADPARWGEVGHRLDSRRRELSENELRGLNLILTHCALNEDVTGSISLCIVSRSASHSAKVSNGATSVVTHKANREISEEACFFVRGLANIARPRAEHSDCPDFFKPALQTGYKGSHS